MPRFKVIVHRRVHKFFKGLEDEKVKYKLMEVMAELKDYPLALRRLDTRKLEGLKRTYRVRVGDYRIIFFVDKVEGLIYVTHVGRRESIYEG